MPPSDGGSGARVGLAPALLPPWLFRPLSALRRADHEQFCFSRAAGSAPNWYCPGRYSHAAKVKERSDWRLSLSAAFPHTPWQVISPDPNLDLDGVGVPMHVARVLTYPQRVFGHFSRLRRWKPAGRGGPMRIRAVAVLCECCACTRNAGGPLPPSRGLGEARPKAWCTFRSSRPPEHRPGSSLDAPTAPRKPAFTGPRNGVASHYHPQAAAAAGAQRRRRVARRQLCGERGGRQALPQVWRPPQRRL